MKKVEFGFFGLNFSASFAYIFVYISKQLIISINLGVKIDDSVGV